MIIRINTLVLENIFSKKWMGPSTIQLTDKKTIRLLQTLWEHDSWHFGDRIKNG